MKQVLIYGPRKAGTTLFQRLLDGDENFFVHPDETKIKLFLKDVKKPGRDFASLNENKVRGRYFRSANKKWAEVDEKVYKNHILKDFKSIVSLQDYIELDIEASMNAMGIAPSEMNGWAIKEISGQTRQIINAFLNAFPDGKVLAIHRDPRDISNAVLREKKKLNSKMTVKRAFNIASQPYGELRELNTFKENPRLLHVYYEKLVADTEAVMKDVCGFLEVSYSDIFSKPTIKGVDCMVPTSSKETKKVFNSKRSLRKGISLSQYLFILFFAILNFGQLSNYKKGLK